jgi:para-aminobenzoate synthetase
MDALSNTCFSYIDLPSELQVTAWTYDPENPSRKVLMGLQHRERPIFGTQWHPESVCSAHGKQIVSNFRDIVLDFWATSNPRNQWTKRRVSENASLPQHILQENVVVGQTSTAFEARERPSRSSISDSPYYVKSAVIGKGPAAEIVFQSLFRGVSSDGEAWLDSAKVLFIFNRMLSDFTSDSNCCIGS